MVARFLRTENYGRGTPIRIMWTWEHNLKYLDDFGEHPFHLEKPAAMAGVEEEAVAVWISGVSDLVVAALAPADSVRVMVGSSSPLHTDGSYGSDELPRDIFATEFMVSVRAGGR